MATATTATMSPPIVAGQPLKLTLFNGKTVEFSSNEALEVDYVPVIDVGRLYSAKLEDRQALADEIGQAARNIGFLTIVNHGIDLSLADRVFEQAKKFFAQDHEKKMEVYTGLIPSEYIGYHPMEEYNSHGQKYQELYEAFNWNYDAAIDPDAPDGAQPAINMWPSGLPGFQAALCAYQTALLGLARRLARVFALALRLPEDAFDASVREPEAAMRVLHYPVQRAAAAEQSGIGAHTDVEHFTLVTQEDCHSHGLEVLSKDGRWVKVRPCAGALVLNIADCFMRQTNDVFVSTIHRVINNESGRDRYACPFFFGFNRATPMLPIPSCISAENPQKYPVMTAGEYYRWRVSRQKATGQSGKQGY